MTFIPTPKVDQRSIDELYDAAENVIHDILSRLYWAEQAENWAASAIADIYARLPGLSASWKWSTVAPPADPGSGHATVLITSGTNNRHIAVSKVDADSMVRNLSTLAQGSMIVLTDDPDTPPTTAFRQYLVTSTPVDHGGWLSFQALRVATFGTQDIPAAETRVRLLFR